MANSLGSAVDAPLTDVNILMPIMHPSWSINIVQRKFGCEWLTHADDLSLTGISAHAAIARALTTGDLLRNEQDGRHHVGGFQSASFDWLYFKGRTIQIVNSRLLNTESAVADSTISAICDLILFEVCVWSCN